MSSDWEFDGHPAAAAPLETVEYLLFDSLVHHLIEKGLLTRNDALSVIQTAAQVVQGKLQESDGSALPALARTYASFEALPDRYGRPGQNADNVLPLRVPLHGERPRFPADDD